MRVQRGFHVGGQDRPPRRNTIRHRCQVAAGRDEAVLMGMQAEDDAPQHLVGAGIDAADGAVAVFYREREVAFLERCAHPLMLGSRHAAFEDQALGAAAETAPERRHQAVVPGGDGQRDLIQPAFTGRRIPKSKSLCPCVNGRCRL